MTEYYLCSCDAIPYLSNKRYLFVHEYNDYSLAGCHVKLTYHYNMHDSSLLLLLAEDLTSDEVLILTLACERFGKTTSASFSTYFETVINNYTWEYIHNIVYVGAPSR